MSSILSQGMEPFMSISIEDGGVVARGTEPDSELLTPCLKPTCTLTVVNAVKQEGNSAFQSD